MRVARLAATEWGVLSLDQLRACGLSRDQVAVRVANGRLHPRHRAVYAVGHANPPLEGRFLAAVKACGPWAVLSHYAAGVLWEFVEWDERDPEITMPGTSARVQAGIRVHRTRHLDARDVTRHRGIPVTAPARTLLDLAAILDERSLRRAAGQAQALRRVNVRQLAELLARQGARPGAARLAGIVAAGPVPTRSELEDVVLALLRSGGFRRPDVNVPLVLDGRRVIPDFRWPEERLIVEADSRAWHDHRIAREDDAERQALLEQSGERVLRVTWAQAIARRDQTLARLRAAGAPRGAGVP